MSKSRMMGAAHAGSTLYNSNINLKTCGGNKKQGLPFSISTGMDFVHRAIQINAIGNKRDVVFTINQLGGVSSSSFSSSSHSYTSGGGFKSAKPFICAPYCNSKGLNLSAVPSTDPLNIEAVIPVPYSEENPIFSYCFYDGYAHCYTDATLAKNVIDFEKATVGNITIQEYLTLYFNNSNVNISSIEAGFFDALEEEDMINGDKSLLMKDRVFDTFYSTPQLAGFPRGTSICSKLYEAMALSYPENVNTCPQRQPILDVGDEFLFSGTFIFGSEEHIINFNIRMV